MSGITPVQVEPLRTGPGRTGGWLLREFILPLTPFIVSAVVRVILAGKFSRSVFDAADLSITMSLFCALMLGMAYRNPDRDFAHALAVPFLIGMFMFVAFFVLAVVMESFQASTLADACSQIRQTPTNANVVLTRAEVIVSGFGGKIDIVRNISVVLALITIAAAVYCRAKYRLQD